MMTKWKTAYNHASRPTADEFNGYYRVRMRGWTALLFWPFFVYRNQKFIVDERGENHWLWKWGEFRTESNVFSDCIYFDYDVSNNNWFGRRILDRVRRLPDGGYIGKFTYDISGYRYKHICWFTLEKIKNSLTKERMSG